MIVRCPSCGRNRSDKTPACPFCTGPAPDAAPSAAGRSERTLLILALPMLSLNAALLGLTAKRWGRVPLYGLIIDVIFILGLAYAVGPTLLVVVLGAASIPLFLLTMQRLGEGKLERGFLLGYSWPVTWRLGVGGALAWVFGAAFFPLSEVTVASRIFMEGRAVPRQAIQDNEVIGGTFVTLTGERVDWDRLVFYAKDPTPRFYSFDPRGEKALSAEDLLANAGQLVGRHVRLDVGSVPTGVVERTGVRFRRVSASVVKVAESDGTTRLWAPVPGGERYHSQADFRIRLWVASGPLEAPGGPERDAFLSRSVHEGLFVEHYLDSDGGRLVQFAVMAGTGTAAAAPAEPSSTPTAEAWAPLADADFGFWVSFPDGVPERREGPLFGIYRRFTEEQYKAVLDHVQKVIGPRRLPADYQMRHLEVTTRKAYLRRLGFFQGSFFRFGFWIVAAMPGFLVLAGAVRRAVHE